MGRRFSTLHIHKKIQRIVNEHLGNNLLSTSSGRSIPSLDCGIQIAALFLAYEKD